MQAAGDCRITYTSIAGVFSRMFNICTQKSEPITNYIDAFALPEGDVYIHPYKGISFFEMKDANATQGSNEPFYTDPAHQGNYQSLGILPGSTPEKRLVRIAMGNASGSIRDYSVLKNGNGFKITPIQNSVTPVCKNLPSLGLDTETPVISRDGQMIAGRELNSRKTQIYRIKMPSGDCELVRTIPLATSKVSFMFDNKNVLYVIKDPNSQNGRLLKMNIESGEILTVSGPDEDVFYMTARMDGTIFYNRKSSLISLFGSQLVELAPDAVAARSGDLRKYEAIGLMWGDACKKPIDADYAIAVGMRMTPDTCDAIVTEKNLAALEEEYAGLTRSDLLSLCRGTQGKDQRSQPGVR